MTRAKTQRPKPRAPTVGDKPPRPPRRADTGALATDAIPTIRAQSVGDEQYVEITELPELPTLQLAVFEGAPYVQAASAAIVAAGHVVVMGGTGRDGLEKIRAAVSSGVIDAVLLGIPGGEPIIDAALALAPRSPVVIAAYAGSVTDAIARAYAVGADLAVVRPHAVDGLAPVLFAAARLVEQRRALAAARGSETLLRARLENLTEGDGPGLQPFELFQRVLELELKRAKRYQYPLSVALFAVEIPPPAPPPGVRGILRARVGNAIIHSIRDIDLATEIDQERFLVLLPYTDLSGAAGVARRVISAVTEGAPVVATGRTFAPRITGAVAGAKPGQQLSFGKLMRDATRALEQARRDGAELAVEP